MNYRLILAVAVAGIIGMIALATYGADVTIVTTNTLKDVELNFGYTNVNSLVLIRALFDEMDPANAGIYTKARFQNWANRKINEVLRQEALAYMQKNQPKPPAIVDASQGVSE